MISLKTTVFDIKKFNALYCTGNKLPVEYFYLPSLVISILMNYINNYVLLITMHTYST